MLRIKEVRESKHLTQTEVAERMGIKQSTYAEIEGGNPTVETLSKIAEVLEVNPAELIADTRPKKKARSLDALIKQFKIVGNIVEDLGNVLSVSNLKYRGGYIHLFCSIKEVAKEYNRTIETEDKGNGWKIHSITVDGVKIIEHEMEELR